MVRPETLLHFFKALADESRLKIVGLLAGGERNVRELAAPLRLKEPTVSHHLAVLRDLGLATMRADGNTHGYRLDHDALRATSRLVLKTQNFVRIADYAASEAWERKVLRSFVDGGRRKKIPASRRKRWAILKWLARHFEPDTDYTEADVNRILARRHPDRATLRRELVAYHMLRRERGIYRRMPERNWRRPDR